MVVFFAFLCYNDFIEDEIVDINLLWDFRYVINDSICALHSICCLSATRFISYRVLSKAKNISILRKQKYRANGVCISTRQGASFLSPNYKMGWQERCSTKTLLFMRFFENFIKTECCENRGCKWESKHFYQSSHKFCLLQK